MDVQKYKQTDVAHKAYSEIEGNNISVENQDVLEQYHRLPRNQRILYEFLRLSALQKVCSPYKFW